MTTQREQQQDTLLLQALNQAGVDNWTWYDDSLYGLTEEDLADDTTVLEALRQGGVDNWDGYEFALESYDDMLHEHGLTDDDGAPEGFLVTPEPKVEPEPKPEEPESAQRLRRIVGDAYDTMLDEGFWKMNTNPKAFEKARKVIATTGSIEQARMKYLDEIYGINAGW